MCLSVVGRVVEVKDGGRFAIVDFSGARREINVELVGAKAGDNVMVHAGFAIKVLSDDEFFENKSAIEEIDADDFRR